MGVQLPSLLEKAPVAGGEGRDGDCDVMGGRGAGAIPRGSDGRGPGHSTRGAEEEVQQRGLVRLAWGQPAIVSPPGMCPPWNQTCLHPSLDTRCHHSPGPDQEPGALSSPLSLEQSCPWVGLSGLPQPALP